MIGDLLQLILKKRHRRPMACWESPLGSPALAAASSCASRARDPGGDSDRSLQSLQGCTKNVQDWRKNAEGVKTLWKMEMMNKQERVENAETNLQVVDGRGCHLTYLTI